MLSNVEQIQKYADIPFGFCRLLGNMPGSLTILVKCKTMPCFCDQWQYLSALNLAIKALDLLKFLGNPIIFGNRAMKTSNE